MGQERVGRSEGLLKIGVVANPDSEFHTLRYKFFPNYVCLQDSVARRAGQLGLGSAAVRVFVIGSTFSPCENDLATI